MYLSSMYLFQENFLKASVFDFDENCSDQAQNLNSDVLLKVANQEHMH